MCYDDDSSPPIEVIDGGVGGHGDLVLTATDGNQFAAFSATSSQRKGPGVVILPDVRGLHRFYEQLALRFAENGYDSVAIDYFGRTAGIGKRRDAFPYADHVPLTTVEGVTADTAAAIAAASLGLTPIAPSSRSDSASGAATPGFRPQPGTASPERSASMATPSVRLSVRSSGSTISNAPCSA